MSLRVADMTPEQHEARRQSYASYKKRHPERVRAALYLWREKRRDIYLSVQRRYYDASRERHVERCRSRWANLAPERRTAEVQRALAKKKKILGRICRSCLRSDGQVYWSSTVDYCSACYSRKLKNGTCRCGATLFRRPAGCPKGCEPPQPLPPWTSALATAVLTIADLSRLVRSGIAANYEAIDRVMPSSQGERKPESTRRWADRYLVAPLKAVSGINLKFRQAEEGEDGGPRLIFDIVAVERLAEDHGDAAARFLDGVRKPAPKRQRQKRYLAAANGQRRIAWRGECLTLAQWAERLGIGKDALMERLKRWPLKRALTATNQSFDTEVKS